MRFLRPHCIRLCFFVLWASACDLRQPFRTAVTPTDSTVCPAFPTSLRSFPSFENGGLIIFFHVPKTGGTTIRRFLRDSNITDFRFARDYVTYNETVPAIENAIVNGTVHRQILAVEIHAKDSPSLYRLRWRLRRWRETAKANGVELFIFTVLREVISYQLSHFNFFHVQRRNPSFEQCNATVEEFIRLSLENPQCRFLYGGEFCLRAMWKTNAPSVGFKECQDVCTALRDTIDWVGTTERLSFDTLPFLASILGLPPEMSFVKERVTTNQDKSVPYLTSVMINETVKDMILQKSLLDNSIYRSFIQ